MEHFTKTPEKGLKYVDQIDQISNDLGLDRE